MFEQSSFVLYCHLLIASFPLRGGGTPEDVSKANGGFPDDVAAEMDSAGQSAAHTALVPTVEAQPL